MLSPSLPSYIAARGRERRRWLPSFSLSVHNRLLSRCRNVEIPRDFQERKRGNESALSVCSADSLSASQYYRKVCWRVCARAVSQTLNDVEMYSRQRSLDRPDLDSRNHLARSRRRRSRRRCTSTSPRRSFDLSIRGPRFSFQEIHTVTSYQGSPPSYMNSSHGRRSRGERDNQRGNWSSADRERERERSGKG